METKCKTVPKANNNLNVLTHTHDWFLVFLDFFFFNIATSDLRLSAYFSVTPYRFPPMNGKRKKNVALQRSVHALHVTRSHIIVLFSVFLYLAANVGRNC